MMFSGESIQISMSEAGLAHLVFDLKEESVNKFNVQTTLELSKALDALEGAEGVRGLLISSAKQVFIVGADITEFGSLFSAEKDEISKHIRPNAENFNRIEDLPFPTVVAINGYALGGGLELCLSCDFRLMSPEAKIGLPETKLGLLPGWGGTVRLPRLAGLDTAVEWIAGGLEIRANDALNAGVVDGVVPLDQLQHSALDLLQRAAEGKMPYMQRREQKKGVIRHNDMEGLLAFESSKLFVGAKAGKHYPAPVAAIKVMQDGAKLERDEAQKIELAGFVELAKTSAARNLVGLFLNDQVLGKTAKSWERKASRKTQKSAVIGAGIMGGGIAYQSAYKGIPVVMKDIAQEGIDLGLSEATKLLSKRVDSGRMAHSDMAATLNRIDPTLGFDGLDAVDIVVEAVVENPKIKKSVLAELEKNVSQETVLCTNTSTISIDELAEGLTRPEQFCGMHFFNPVHKMPLVEIIRGSKTSEDTIARTVEYANRLGKKPVVVNNCPGFLVNRILFPYFAGFAMLVRDGADYLRVDKVMERWGWPMGPAYLLDVVGMDTAVHAGAVMANGFPERLSLGFKSASEMMFDKGRLGQKNQKGFYDYLPDRKGQMQKTVSESAKEALKGGVAESAGFEDDEIIERMMIPMAFELVRCLEEGIVSSAAEADMALIYGIGFPPFRGGIFRWIDEQGVTSVLDMADKYKALGALYQPTEGFKQKSSNGESYYGV